MTHAQKDLPTTHTSQTTQTSQTIKRVLILEDQPQALNMLKQVLKEVLKTATIDHASDLAALAGFCPSDYQLFLVDLRLPDGLSFDYIRSFKQACPDTPAIVTTLYADDDLVFSAMRSGADGYLLKGDGNERLILSLQRLLQGEPPISPTIARKLMRSFEQLKLGAGQHLQPQYSDEPDLQEVLTPRQIDVLTLIGKGLLVKQVASHLGISPYTVNDNIKAIYKKLDINSRAEATLHASRGGLV